MVTTWISWFVNAYPNKKLIGYAYKEQIVDVLPSFVLAILMGIMVWTIGFSDVSIGLILILQIMAGILLYLLLSLVFKPTPYKLVVAYLKERL